MFIDASKVIDVCKMMTNKKLIKLSYNLLKSKTYVAIFMHGSGGFNESSMEYMKFLNSIGYTVVAPDHVAYHKHVQDIKYNSTNEKACTFHNQLKYKYAIHFRMKEIQVIMNLIHNTASKIILFGVSEGAIAVSLYKTSVPVVKVMCAFYPSMSYFIKQKGNFANVKDHLYILGTHDEYFSPYTNSINKNVECGMLKAFSTKVIFIPFATHSLIKHNTHKLLTFKVIHSLVQGKI